MTDQIMTDRLTRLMDGQPFGLAIPTGILGTGLHVPPRVVSNTELVRNLDTSDEWIQEKLGIRERRFLSADRTTSDMCVDASMQAIDAAGVTPDEIDAIVLATLTPDHPLPSMAIAVAERIGARNAIPVDLTQSVCASGVLSILLASHLLQNGAIRNVLVIGADAMSRVTDPAERTTRAIFGDAAGAVVMGRVPDGYGLLSWDLGTEQSYAVGIKAGGAARPTTAHTVAAGEHYLHMDGKVVWRLATTHLSRSIAAAVQRAGAELADVRYFALHQANRNILLRVMDQLGVPADRAGVTVDVLGNTCSASIFTVLHAGLNDCVLTKDDLLVVSGIGAGFLWGALCFRLF